MKKQLSVWILSILLFSLGCSEDQTPQNGTLELKLTFSRDLEAEDAPFIELVFPGGLYQPSKGRIFVTDKYSTSRGENIQYQITTAAYGECTKLSVEAVYGGKVIQTDNFEFGNNCTSDDSYGFKLITKNIVIP
ncbi:MAG: hypothetical protein Q8S14_14865 [Algoriphagus sp.]|uniref:hypothetical protein n=1 Tax=Algoriphagus sp. TaxID=1872435 RepID=UPI00273172DE|nr:hypothetical protein [Algoriphagus sp.]MDP2041848.1 hypothetical protein [Algoriphagus sp.]MDP3473148.1 hypothetical protein [Algoriphagus sp.]